MSLLLLVKSVLFLVDLGGLTLSHIITYIIIVYTFNHNLSWINVIMVVVSNVFRGNDLNILQMLLVHAYVLCLTNK